MPKPKKMPRDAQLPPLKRMRLAPREPETPPPGHEETEIVLVGPDLPQGRGAEIPQPRTFPRRRPQEPSMPPPRGAAASSSGSGGRARRDWDDDRSQRHRNASSDEAAVLERHFSTASPRSRASVFSLPRGCGKSHAVVGKRGRWCTLAVGHADRGEPGFLPQVRYPAVLAYRVAYLPRWGSYSRCSPDAGRHHRCQVT